MLDYEQQENRFQNIKKKFDKFNFVEIIRKKSSGASKLFTNSFFDWVYIDADHSFEGYLQDLNNYNKLVKEDVYILGDDFNNTKKRGYGVNKAVLNLILFNLC